MLYVCVRVYVFDIRNRLNSMLHTKTFYMRNYILPKKSFCHIGLTFIFLGRWWRGVGKQIEEEEKSGGGKRSYSSERQARKAEIGLYFLIVGKDVTNLSSEEQ